MAALAPLLMATTTDCGVAPLPWVDGMSFVWFWCNLREASGQPSTSFKRWTTNTCNSHHPTKGFILDSVFALIFFAFVNPPLVTLPAWYRYRYWFGSMLRGLFCGLFRPASPALNHSFHSTTLNSTVFMTILYLYMCIWRKGKRGSG